MDQSENSCTACDAGKYSGDAASSCSACPAGTHSVPEATGCTDCAAGTYAVAGSSSCGQCAAGTFSEAREGSCTSCPAGTYSTGGQADECLKCGDNSAIYDLTLWDPNQSGLTSEGECKCALGRTGSNCDQETCANTMTAASLGFLLLEVQWPRHVRQLSRNEAFSGISGAFRAFDANSDDHLTVDEARAGIADGGMTVPSKVLHIWSRDGIELSEDEVTITDMIQDELDRLETQGTKDYHDRPSDSGAITAMEATYPNPLTKNDECKSQNDAKPLLEWTVNRSAQNKFYGAFVLNHQPPRHRRAACSMAW